MLPSDWRSLAPACQRAATRVVDIRVGIEARAVEHSEARLEIRHLRWIALPEEHIAGEQIVPRILGDDAHRKAVTLVRARITILHKYVLSA